MNTNLFLLWMTVLLALLIVVTVWLEYEEEQTEQLRRSYGSGRRASRRTPPTGAQHQ